MSTLIDWKIVEPYMGIGPDKMAEQETPFRYLPACHITRHISSRVALQQNMNYRNIPIRSALRYDIVEGAPIPCLFGHHGGAYSVFGDITV